MQDFPKCEKSETLEDLDPQQKEIKETLDKFLQATGKKILEYTVEQKTYRWVIEEYEEPVGQFFYNTKDEDYVYCWLQDTDNGSVHIQEFYIEKDKSYSLSMVLTETMPVEDFMVKGSSYDDTVFLLDIVKNAPKKVIESFCTFANHKKIETNKFPMVKESIEYLNSTNFD